MQISSQHKATLIWRLVLVVVIALITLNGENVEAQSNSIYLNGHNISGPFFTFFNEHGGLRIFGFPITEAFDYGGLRVQYFQKARMELHPENPPAYLVQLGLLSDQLRHGTPPLPPSSSDRFHRYFPQTGHTVAFEFLNFFDNNGGLDIFGYPIDEFRLENGHYVQYFQRMKMEWHPELSSSEPMHLVDLGSIYFDVARLPVSLRDPAPTTFGPSTPTPAAIKVTASVLSPITGRSGQQTLYVFVTDEQENAVPNATAFYVVRALGSSAPLIPIGQTNSEGFVSMTFAINGSHLGQQWVIEVRATLNALRATTQISYVPWY
jgi:hypothetical protein